MSTKDTRTALLGAFRETTLSLIGLFDVYDADEALTEATAEALAQVFRAHLKRSEPEPGDGDVGPLHALLDEIDAAVAEAA